jgi:hypothetical protein
MVYWRNVLARIDGAIPEPRDIATGANETKQDI